VVTKGGVPDVLDSGNLFLVQEQRRCEDWRLGARGASLAEAEEDGGVVGEVSDSGEDPVRTPIV
jgi:hypothetical protein